MKGFILNIKKVKEEDLIVTILTENEVVVTYRFYGARHSYINIGYFIDFEIEYSIKSSIGRLRDVMQINMDFLLNRDAMIVWQEYIKLMYKHLKDVEEVPPFYFYHLFKISNNLLRNPKRVVIENFIELLEEEGRLHNDFFCFHCDEKIDNKVVLVTAFLPSCQRCVSNKVFDLYKIEELFNNKKSILLNDEEIEELYKTLKRGI